MRLVALANASRGDSLNPGESSQIAILVSRGTSNNLFQVATLVRAATALDFSVRVLFEGDAVLKLARSRVNDHEWAKVYAPVLSGLVGRLAAAEFESMEQFLRDARDHGDDTRFWVAVETLTENDLGVGDLVASIDGPLPQHDFEAQTLKATRVFF